MPRNLLPEDQTELDARVQDAAVATNDDRRDPVRPQPDRFKQSGREEIKLLAKAEASVVESERRVTRQTALIMELRSDGLATLEAEKSLLRLEAAVLEQRAQRDIVMQKAKDVGGTGD